MLFQVSLDNPRLTMRKGLALNKLIAALVHVPPINDFLIGQYPVTAIFSILTLEFKLS